MQFIQSHALFYLPSSLTIILFDYFFYLAVIATVRLLNKQKTVTSNYRSVSINQTNPICHALKTSIVSANADGGDEEWTIFVNTTEINMQETLHLKT